MLLGISSVLGTAEKKMMFEAIRAALTSAEGEPTIFQV
jgi:hypothetical protein